MTSQGILDFASELHRAVTAMDREVDATQSTKVSSQAWLGPWTDYVHLAPWTEPPPRGLIDLVAEIRGPLHVINATADFQRLDRFNRRLQSLWDDGSKGDSAKSLSGHSWSEPRPDDRVPGKSRAPGDVALDLGGDLGTAVVVLLGLYLWDKYG